MESDTERLQRLFPKCVIRYAPHQPDVFVVVTFGNGGRHAGFIDDEELARFSDEDVIACCKQRAEQTGGGTDDTPGGRNE